MYRCQLALHLPELDNMLAIFALRMQQLAAERPHLRLRRLPHLTHRRLHREYALHPFALYRSSRHLELVADALPVCTHTRQLRLEFVRALPISSRVCQRRAKLRAPPAASVFVLLYQ